MTSPEVLVRSGREYRGGRLTAHVWLAVLVVGVLPYAGLKVAWLSGSQIGVPPGSPATSGSFQIANAVTLSLDVLAVVLGVLLVSGRGLRVAALPVVLVAWCGTGLLVPALFQVLGGFAVTLATEGRLVALDDGLVSESTYVLVYTCFALQGLALGMLVRDYALRRWPIAGHHGRWSLQSTAAIRQSMCGLAGLLAALALLRWSGAVAAPAWLGTDWAPAARLGALIDGALCLFGSWGLLSLAAAGTQTWERWQGRRPGVTLAAVWLASGALATWGGFRLLVLAAGPPSGHGLPFAVALLDLAGLVIGLLVAVLVFTVVSIPGISLSRDAPARTVGNR